MSAWVKFVTGAPVETRTNEPWVIPPTVNASEPAASSMSVALRLPPPSTSVPPSVMVNVLLPSVGSSFTAATAMLTVALARSPSDRRSGT